MFIRQTKENQLLLEIYKIGWEDQRTQASQKSYKDVHHDIAYTLGRNDYFAGKTIDYHTNEQILKRIP